MDEVRAALLAAEMPAYADEFMGPCGCGKCPKAKDQTRVEEVRRRADEFAEDVERYEAKYHCGVCGDAHRRVCFIRLGVRPNADGRAEACPMTWCAEADRCASSARS